MLNLHIMEGERLVKASVVEYLNNLVEGHGVI